MPSPTLGAILLLRDSKGVFEAFQELLELVRESTVIASQIRNRGPCRLAPEGSGLLEFGSALA